MKASPAGPRLPAEYTIRRAVRSDIAAILDLLAEVTRWLGRKGLDQWQHIGRRDIKVQTDVNIGTVFVVEHHGCVVATITVDRWADADFWRREDNVTRALYVHRMAVTRTHSGIGLGAAMLDWAAARARGRGRSLLRLDAWATNGALHAYYEGLGFEHVRTETVDGRGSGALFARPAAARGGLGPALVDRHRLLAPGASYYRHRYGRRLRRVVPSRPAVA